MRDVTAVPFADRHLGSVRRRAVADADRRSRSGALRLDLLAVGDSEPFHMSFRHRRRGGFRLYLS